MVVRDWLSNALNDIMNCIKTGKFETRVWPVNKLMLNVFELMKKHGYIEEIKISQEKNYKIAELKISKKLHECRAIKPRFTVKKKFFDKYVRRYLPARDIGLLIVSTDKGVMNYQEAIEKGLGGVLIAYCF
ncbi:MAG: 30S ribosomal protein S8 [Candidatus Pacearchaeota archaeon]